jgi:AAT family amino acid transporter
VPWWGFGVANLAVVVVLAVVSWWVLVDPEWSAFGLYPQPFNALLFWVVLGTVWVGFTFEWLGPTSLKQPWRGMVGIGLTIAIGVAVTLLLAQGWGAIDPSFSADREGGAGYTTGALFVLFGFFFYVLSAVNAGHWPWSRASQQPMTGLGELCLVLVPTLVVYAVLVLPNLAVWAMPDSALMSLPTVIGWFYSLVVAAIVTGLLAENLPWSLARGPAATAVAALVGNVVLGTALYFVLRAVAELLMGSDNVAALGDAVPSHAAELGVCWAFWMIAWANVFGNKPTGRARGVNIVIRVIVTFVLAVLTYWLYYFVVAESVLHEPAAGGTLSGDALGFLDWAVLWMLWYVLFLGSLGLPRPRGEVQPDAEPAATGATLATGEVGR